MSARQLSISWLLLPAVAVVFYSCGYMRLAAGQFKEAVASLDLQSPLTVVEPEAGIDGVLTGSVSGVVPEGGQIVVAAFATAYSAAENRQSERLANYLLLPAAGPYALFVPAGRYRIVAFVDADRDFVLEPDEFAGRCGRPDAISISSNQLVADLDIELAEPGQQRFDFPVSLQNLPLRQVSPKVLEYGGRIELGNELFQRKYGSMGLWQPADFVEKIGVHLYSPEPFDIQKIPVLFIHGINGTPRDWKYLANGLDSRSFQPWFYYYPSGLRLNLVAGLLVEKIMAVHRRYGFEKLVVVAHSMGGLVARAFIDRCATLGKNGCPQLFVSISTPWSGDKTAQVGLSSSPLTVPSWQDVAEGSPFIEDLHRQPLPPDVAFYLFFSYGGNRRFHWDANDGTVTLQSQLDPRAKSQARQTDGFYEDHITVLASSKVEQRLNELLAAEVLGRTPGAVRNPSKIKSEAVGAGNGSRATGDQGPPADATTAVADPLPAEVRRYVDMLQSVDSGSQTEAARRIYRQQLKHPAIFETAADQLQKGYRVNLADNAHIDAMAWMCNLLGMSAQASYRTLLRQVARETPSTKIQRHAVRSIRQLTR